MRSSEVVQGTRRWLPVVLVGVIIAGLLGTTAVLANDVPPECAVSGPSLRDARARYRDSCSLPRIDCDEIDDIWYCSSRVIGAAAPAGVTADEVGASAIGSDGTVVVTNPPTTTGPPTTVLPTTAPSTEPTPTTPTSSSATTGRSSTSPPRADIDDAFDHPSSDHHQTHAFDRGTHDDGQPHTFDRAAHHDDRTLALDDGTLHDDSAHHRRRR